MKKRILSMLLVIVMVLSLVPVSALADGITISGKNYMGEGESVELTLSGVNATGSVVSEDTSVVEVAWSATTPEKCTVRGVGEGKTNITVTAGTETKTFPVAVYKRAFSAPSVSTTDTTVDLASREVTLEYEVSAGTETQKVVRWSSSNKDVATVNYLGVLTLHKPGTTDIKVFYNGLWSDAVTFTVEEKQTGLTITPSRDTPLYPNRTLELTASVGGVAVDGVKWHSEKPEIVSVDTDTGIVTSYKVGGPVKITAQKKGYIDAEYQITVVGNEFWMTDASGRKLEDVVNLKAGQTLNLQVWDKSGTAQPGFTFEILGATQALTVTPSGELEGKIKTVTPIEVQASKGNAKVTQKFSVQNNTMVIKAGDVTLNAEDGYSVIAGNQVQLTAVDSVANQTVKASWNITDSTPDYVSVDSTTGLLDAKTATTTPATLTVTAAGYDTVTLPVTVRAKGTFSNLVVEEGKLIVNQGCHLIAQDEAGNAVEGVKWEIVSGTAKLEGNVLTVESAEVTSVRVKATRPDYEEKLATFTSEVVEPENVVVKLGEEDFPEVLTMIVGDELNLNVQPVPSAISYPDNITVTSSDTDVVKIENGKLVAEGPGEATLTASYGTARAILWAGKVKVKATTEIVLDETMPLELICGESMNLQAVLKNAAGETLETPVQWRLKNDKVIKNLVDLTANKLTAYPQSTYDFTVELEAFVDDDKVEVVEVPIHVIPRTTNIILMNDTEDISEKTIVLNVNDPNGITIDAVTKPSDARQVVDWEITGPNDIFKPTRGDSSIVIQPVSAQKTGTITLTATAKDGTGISRKTTIVFAKMADNVLITNAPKAMRGGANIQLRTNLDEDKTITDRRVEWSIVGGDNQYASVTKDGFLDTAKVTDRVMVSVKATMIANPEKTDVKDIWLCPAVNLVKIVMEDGTQTNAKSVVNFADGDIQLGMIAYPAGHIGSEETDPVGAFVWMSSNEKIATVDPATGLVTLHDAGNVRISCTAYDTDFETALKIARGEIHDDSKVMAIGYKTLEIVKAAGFVAITPPVNMPLDDEERGQLISGKNAVLTAAVYTEEEGALAANQKVTWSVEDVYGNPTKAATINSRGRLYAKTVNYGTEVVVYATSVENKNVVGEFHVMIQPKKERTFVAFLEDDDRIIEAPVYMNTNETAVISGQWYIRDIGFDPAEDCLFFSSNRSVATIDQYDGTLETYQKGSTTITVRATDPNTRNVYTAKFTLHVVNTVDHIVISKPNNTPNYVRSGSYMNLSATVWSNVIETIKADNQGVTWGVYEEYGDELVATKAAYMTSNGALVAYSVTENTDVVVVATSKENPSITAEFPMTIRPASAYTVTARCMDEDSGKMVVPTGAVNLEVMAEDTAFTTEIDVKVYVSDPNSEYDWKNLPGAAIVWETSNKDIVKVVGGKLYYTGKTGKVNVTPTFKAGNVTYRGNTITLNIMKFVDGIEVTKKYANQELYSGKSLVMYAIVDEYATTRRVTWSLVGDGDEAFASINPTTGLIRAKKGLTEQEMITVRATAVDGSGEYDEMGVTIYPLATRVAIEGAPTGAIEKGDTEKLTAVLFVGAEDDQANQEAVKWTSSRSSIVSVDKEGNITAKRRGTATIKAKAVDGSGKYATIRITVVNP